VSSFARRERRRISRRERDASRLRPALRRLSLSPRAAPAQDAIHRHADAIDLRAREFFGSCIRFRISTVNGMRSRLNDDFQTYKLELKMKTTQTLLALVIAAIAPLAAQAESPDAIKFNDAPSTLSAAQVRADYLAMDKSGQRFGEAYPIAISNGASVLTRQEVRADYLAMDRSGQRFGEAYPTPAVGTTITSAAGMHADVR